MSLLLKDIPQLVDYRGVYHVDCDWEYFHRDWLPQQIEELNLQLDPDFQRGHVWTTEQQTAYVEFCLRGGRSSRTLLFNHPNWRGDYTGDFVLVDGLQRVTAVTEFLENRLMVFGHTRSEYADAGRIRGHAWSIYVHELPTRAKVLEWYLQLNSGGTPHAASEIERVRKLLEKEREVVQ